MSAVLALLCSLALAQGGVKTGHWEKKRGALLFFDSAGALSAEYDFIVGDDSSTAKIAEGGVSPDARMAWFFEKTTRWDSARAKILGTTRHLRLFGSHGGELWGSTEADIPRSDGEPLIFSQDSQTQLLSERRPKGWRVAARDYMGRTLMEVGPFAELQGMALTPDGRFAMVRWRVFDQSATHTFLDIVHHTRKDIPSDTFPLGKARLADDGKVYAGDQLVVDLAVAVSTAPPAAGKP